VTASFNWWYDGGRHGPNPTAKNKRQNRKLMADVEKLSLTAITRTQLDLARQSSSGRSATTVFGGHEHTLRQTVIAISASHDLDEHANPGEATVYVLHGRVRLAAGDVSWDGSHGDLLIVPNAPHSLEALEDAVVLLTVAKHSQ